MTNRERSIDDQEFRLWCKRAGVKPTKRQASKYVRGFGLAHRARESWEDKLEHAR